MNPWLSTSLVAALCLAFAGDPGSASAQSCGIACAVRPPSPPGGCGIACAARPRPAAADTISPTCGQHPTFTDFIDYPYPVPGLVGVCGRVAGNNAWWALLPGGWDNRADAFRNNGTWTNCLYDGADYTGNRWQLWSGENIEVYDSVTSNVWRQGGC
jgi:hypothetical protein